MRKGDEGKDGVMVEIVAERLSQMKTRSPPLGHGCDCSHGCDFGGTVAAKASLEHLKEKMGSEEGEAGSRDHSLLFQGIVLVPKK